MGLAGRARLPGGLDFRAPDPVWSPADSLSELEALAATARVVVAGSTLLPVRRPNPATLIGPGQAAEIARRVTELDCQTVIFDDNLLPRQQRNLERILKLKVVDRTTLILDIFAAHALTAEGKLQVERRRSTTSCPASPTCGSTSLAPAAESAPAVPRDSDRDRSPGTARTNLRSRRSHREGAPPAVSGSLRSPQARSAPRRTRRLHQRRQVQPPKRPHRRRRPRRKPALRHSRSSHQKPVPSGWPSGAPYRHRRLHPETSPASRRRLSGDSGRTGNGPISSCTWSTLLPRPASNRSTPWSKPSKTLASPTLP